MAGVELSKVELATWWGVNPTSVNKWVRNGCPYVTKGSKNRPWVFNTADVAAWREEQMFLRAVGDTSQLDIDESKRRKLAAEAAMVELDLAKRRGEVIEIDEIVDVIGDDYANLRAKLLSLPTKLAPLVAVVEDMAECKGLIERGIHEALEELTADGIYGSDSSEVEDSSPEESEPKAAA